MTNESPIPTRDRLVGSMLQSLRTKGLHGVGLTEVLTRAQAPKGVLYHHFPGGKNELAVAAIESVVAHLMASLDKVIAQQSDLFDALAAWMGAAQRTLEKSGFEQGCPLATVALESAAADSAIRNALALAFEAIRGRIADALVAVGTAPGRAAQQAALLVAAYEGALLQSRVAGNVAVMQGTTAALLDLMRQGMAPARAPSPPTPRITPHPKRAGTQSVK